MEPTTFDAFARRFAQRFSRRTALKGAALGLVAAAIPLADRTEAASAASDLVVSFYENIDAYQYKDAYALLGSKWRAQQSLSNFTKGYADTAFVQCQTTTVKTNGANTDVGVTLISWHNDGKIVHYQGSYTVGTEKGKLLILAGNNSVVTPSGESPAPLCKIADLKFGFGSWDAGAGQRYSTIVATNASTKRCAVGGSPRITIDTAAHQELYSTSEPGNPPQAVVLDPNDSAHAPLKFSNWCEATSGNAFTVEVPGDKAHGTINSPTISYPPCLGAGQASTMSIKAFLAGKA
jgi:hypothetical protein